MFADQNGRVLLNYVIVIASCRMHAYNNERSLSSPRLIRAESAWTSSSAFFKFRELIDLQQRQVTLMQRTSTTLLRFMDADCPRAFQLGVTEMARCLKKSEKRLIEC